MTEPESDGDIAKTYLEIVDGLDDSSLVELWMAVLAGRQRDLGEDLRARAVQLEDLRGEVGRRSAQRATAMRDARAQKRGAA